MSAKALKALICLSAAAVLMFALCVTASAESSISLTDVSCSDRDDGLVDVTVTYTAPAEVEEVTMVAATEAITADLLSTGSDKIIGMGQYSNGAAVTFPIDKPSSTTTVYLLMGGTDVSSPSSASEEYIVTYTITFVDEDGTTVLDRVECAQGEVPVYSKTAPTKAEDDAYTYEFAGWTVTPVAATEDATYIAKYNAIPKAAAIKYGDVDANGKVTSNDAVLVLRAAAKLQTLTADQKTAADVDGTGKVTSNDAVLILRKAAKMISKFPVEE